MLFASLVAASAVGCGESTPPPVTRTVIDSGPEVVRAPQQEIFCKELTATIRDFRDDHPDFERTPGVDEGLVEFMLGTDGKPVYANKAGSTTTSGKDNFDQWYRDVDGINQRAEIEIPDQDPDEDRFAFENDQFFPVDDMLLGNQSRPRNYHFTTEIAGVFLYKGGEEFTFVGDDDVFVFVNRRLALDLGGIHGPATRSINFDEQAEMLGLTPGNIYELHLFHAERRTTGSTFRFEINIGCFVLE